VSKKNKKGRSDRDILSKHSKLNIPLIALRNKPLTTYEALVVYLRDDSGFNYHNIAVLLDRDEKDVRKVYFRAKKKVKDGK